MTTIATTPPRIPVYGYNPARMAANLTMAELVELQSRICNDPKSQNPDCATGKSIWKYTKPAHRKLDAIAWAITHKLTEKKRGGGQ